MRKSKLNLQDRTTNDSDKGRSEGIQVVAIRVHWMSLRKLDTLAEGLQNKLAQAKNDNEDIIPIILSPSWSNCAFDIVATPALAPEAVKALISSPLEE